VSVCTCTKANGRGVFVFGAGVGGFVCRACADRLAAPAKRRAALSAARDEVVRAAVAWYGLESGAAVALGRAVAALARLEKS